MRSPSGPLFGGQRITFAFRSGALNLVKGSNGAGKTTLASVVAKRNARALPPELSSCVHWEPNLAAEEIGYLPQHLPGIQDVRFQGILRLAFSSPDSRAGFEGALAPRLRRRRTGRIGELSGGERRLLLLLLLAGQPCKTLVLDEPMVSLDGQARGTATALVDQLVAEGRLIIAVSHDDNWTTQLAARVKTLDVRSFKEN